MTRSLRVAAVVLLLAASAIQAARGDVVGTMAFAGRCNTSQPIGYPLLGINKGATIGVSCSFPSAGLGSYYNSLDPLLLNNWANLSGNLTMFSNDPATGAWCGLSTGTLNGNDGGGGVAELRLTNIGPEVILEGEIFRGDRVYKVVGNATVQPDATTGDSCSVGADTFIVQGKAEQKENNGHCEVENEKNLKQKKGTTTYACHYKPLPGIPEGTPGPGLWKASCPAGNVTNGCAVQISQGGTTTKIIMLPNADGTTCSNPQYFNKPGSKICAYKTANTTDRVTCTITKFMKGGLESKLNQYSLACEST